MVSSDDKLKTIRSVMNIRDSNVLMPPWVLQDALEFRQTAVITQEPMYTRGWPGGEELVRMCATLTMKQDRN